MNPFDVDVLLDSRAAAHLTPQGAVFPRSGALSPAQALLHSCRASLAVIGLHCALLTPQAALAAVPPAPIPQAACNADGFAQVLQPQALPEVDARAYWLDRNLIQWPGKDAGSSYRLHYARLPTLDASPGRPVSGADGAIALQQPTSPVSEDVAKRFKFVGPGVVLGLPSKALPQLPQLLRGSLLLVEEDARGRVLDATRLQLPGVLDDLYGSAVQAPLPGAHPTSRSTTFRLWAPTARAVSLCVHPDDAGTATSITGLQRNEATGVWSAELPTNLSGRYYTYLVDVMVPGVGLVRNRVTDPYSVSLGNDSQRSFVADLDDPTLKPDGWERHAFPDRVQAQTDMVIYELHVRDFSIGDKSVSAPNRGKYLAFTESESAGMQHLRALSEAGMTDVHLLPVFDFATVPETGCVTPDVPDAAPDSPLQQSAVMAVAARDCFNWGYDPYHFNAPEGSYASDAADGAARILEFRRMVMALHQAGLRVGMDVVYNHTTTSGQQLSSVLDRIVPGYYQRLDAKGVVERSTCCDNTATEHLMMARLMIDSAELWATQYGIDSFRFDLMGHQPRAAMELLRDRVNSATGREINLIGEGWNFGEVSDGARFVQASQLALNGSGIGTFSDRARDALRGGGPSDSGAALLQQQGYLNGLVYDRNAHAPPRPAADLLRAADLVRVGLAGSIRDFALTSHEGKATTLEKIDYAGQPAGYASEPAEVVNYVENHDNQTLFDNNVYKLPQATSSEDRARVQLLGLALNAFSQGVAYFHAGTEILRSKSMDRNSYDSGDWFNRLDWTYTDNQFGTGLPPEADNRVNHPLIAPLLRDPSIKPSPRDIAWTRDAFLDLLRIRDSSTLFRMRSAEDIRTRLSFPNVGPEQNPLVMVGHLDGEGYEGAAFRQLIYLVNVSPEPQTLRLEEHSGKSYVLHPVLRASAAADERARQSSYSARTGEFMVPARTAVVYVLE